MSKKKQFITLKGVRQNNLKNFDVSIPIGELTVVTGMSGSGKSSLVFDTLHAEGQRRYVETFSPYVRQFMDTLDRPDLDEIENIRPSIAVEQTHAIRTSRSTVGTMTELTDYFKVWFCENAQLQDPETGSIIHKNDVSTVLQKIMDELNGNTCLIGFELERPAIGTWDSLFQVLLSQGYSRVLVGGKMKKIEADSIIHDIAEYTQLRVIHDRVRVNKQNLNRLSEAVESSFQAGQGKLWYIDDAQLPKEEPRYLYQGFFSATGKRYKEATASLFSYNSPVGACPECKGFGYAIDIDYEAVVADTSKSINAGALKPIEGFAGGDIFRTLVSNFKKNKISLDKPWSELSDSVKEYFYQGEPGYVEGSGKWYGIYRFFDWLESTSYKMHVRMYLSRFRSYKDCPACEGKRLKDEALWWKWNDHTLPDLYDMPVEDLLILLRGFYKLSDNMESYEGLSVALREIITRLTYLNEVGLGYLCLNRTTRTLSGGEVQRVNLTTCIGTSLTDTLFVLDEPSIGLHSRDIGRLIRILNRLTEAGNTVVVVEHDEAIMRAADYLIEIGPLAGSSGGQLVFAGKPSSFAKSKNSLTVDYLEKRRAVPVPNKRRKVIHRGKNKSPMLWFKGVEKNNIQNQNFTIPLQRFVCLSGVSGSGKSTFLNTVMHQALLANHGKKVKDMGRFSDMGIDIPYSEVVLVDQSALSRSSRSNIGIYSKAWEEVRNLYAKISQESGGDLKPGSFSFNSGNGRCQECGGMGEIRIEMQFLSDVFSTCPVCNGRRFTDEVLSVCWHDKNILDLMDMTVAEAAEFFSDNKKISNRLEPVLSVGLGYLKMGQTLSTLSGGEAQRLKLVRYLETKKVGLDEHRILLLDEPTTGLHREDISTLLKVFQQLVERGNSLIVIEHQMDVLKSADWIIEMGPDSGIKGGKVIAEGVPETIAEKKTASSPYLSESLMPDHEKSDKQELMEDTMVQYRKKSSEQKKIEVIEAREHNLKNISVEINPGQLTVITGVSGSGKSTLAFDILFSEGQRRFMESLSSYTRQFVEQLSKPAVRAVYGLSPAVAIEQRETVGQRKSTVATVTEVAHYIRLLYARLGIIVNPETGNRVERFSVEEIVKRVTQTLAEHSMKKALLICSPRIRNRKGHHEPVAKWAEKLKFPALRCDGKIIPLTEFNGLDRYKEHTVEVVIEDLKSLSTHDKQRKSEIKDLVTRALELGGSSFLICDERGREISWFSSKNTDPATGQAFQVLDPKDFSWNGKRGWCETCQGHGRIWEEEKRGKGWIDRGECPDCEGDRLNPVSRAVVLDLSDGSSVRMPELLKMAVNQLIETLKNLSVKSSTKAVLDSVLPEIFERLDFMQEVGLDYLSMDRSAATLSGGEAQRIRLASQLGSYLSGVMYVLDEPSIGLHARDNDKLIDTLFQLRDRGNTLIVVEHDDAIMRRSDQIIDMGPKAGIYGGEVVAYGPPAKLLKSKKSVTAQMLREGMQHPIRGKYRPVSRSKGKAQTDIMELKGVNFRNLKGIEASFPLGRLIGVCGVSGAGKSTLVKDILLPALKYCIEKNKPKLNGGEFKKATQSEEIHFKTLTHANKITRVLEVDQSPIGKTPRSVPATYIGLYDWIRKIFANLPESKIRGFDAGRFSFNVQGGRCESCGGLGKVGIEMNFLPKTYVDCEECNGHRYRKETCEILYRGKSIAEVMQMSFEEAVDFFEAHRKPREVCEWMVQAGLGYLRLGQASPTLSGGEAQRMKIVAELAKGGSYSDQQSAKGRETLYILEEPSIGLHLSDCKRLIQMLHHLVDQGHTVLIIEHNLDLIAEMDWLIELGPDGGDRGGELLYQGLVSGIKKEKNSVTGRYL